MKSYEELEVWQKGIQLVLAIYRLTDLFPKSEIFGLTSQLRRAAIAIPSNIAEGYARKHRAEYIQFSRIAFSSGAEMETQLLIAKKLAFASAEEFNQSEELLKSVMMMLNKLIAALAKTND